MRGLGEAFFLHAVVGGLAVLEAFAAGDIGEREQEVVLVVVVRGVGGVGFAHEVGDFGEERGVQVGILGEVGDDIDVVFRADVGSQRELVEVLAGDDGRVLKLLDVGGGEVCDRSGRRGRARKPPPMGVSAVPTPQPAGTMSEGWMGMSRTGLLAG